MNKLLCNICAAFILGSEKRKMFRIKHFTPSVEYQLKKLSEKVNIIANSLNNIKHGEVFGTFNCLREEILFGVQRSLSIALLHQRTFLEYRNVNQNKTVVLIGAGPTVNFFNGIKNAVFVGLNRAVLLKSVKFDYLFAIDKGGLDIGKEQYYEDFFSYDAVKFIGDQNLGEKYQIPYSKYSGVKNVRCYMTTAGFLPDKFAYDISSQPLANSATVSIQAMQFILYTNPKKIYLVGIDCTIGGGKHFFGGCLDGSSRNEDFSKNDEYNVYMWRKLKEFAETYYPETEIISINPVGLKGMFHDVYTKSYLKEHPEINADEVETLEDKNF